MALLPDVGTFLAANVTDTALTQGTNLFLGRMPEAPDTCVSVYQTAGRAPTDVFGGDTAPPIENPGLMIHVRAVAYSDCQALAEDVMKTLSKVINEALSGTTYYKVAAVQSPFALDRDDKDRMVFSCNFDVTRVL